MDIYMKQIDKINLENKKVIIRVDYNVPLDNELNIMDDNRIRESLKTINYCLSKNCATITTCSRDLVRFKSRFKKCLRSRFRH